MYGRDDDDDGLEKTSGVDETVYVTKKQAEGGRPVTGGRRDFVSLFRSLVEQGTLDRVAVDGNESTLRLRGEHKQVKEDEGKNKDLQSKDLSSEKRKPQEQSRRRRHTYTKQRHCSVHDTAVVQPPPDLSILAPVRCTCGKVIEPHVRSFRRILWEEIRKRDAAAPTPTTSRPPHPSIQTQTVPTNDHTLNWSWSREHDLCVTPEALPKDHDSLVQDADHVFPEPGILMDMASLVVSAHGLVPFHVDSWDWFKARLPRIFKRHCRQVYDVPGSEGVEEVIAYSNVRVTPATLPTPSPGEGASLPPARYYSDKISATTTAAAAAACDADVDLPGARPVGNETLTWPHDCVERASTYAFAVRASVIIYQRDKKTRRPIRPPEVYDTVELGRIPDMVGSSTCNTAFAGTDHPDETLFDGRFIVKGNEYYISPTLSLRRNNIVVFESRPGCKYAVEGQMRPKEAGRDRSTSTIRISLAKQTGTMAVHMPFCQKSEVPLFAVARILGFKKRIELAWCIVSGGMLSGREGEGRLPRSDTQIYRDLSRKAKALVRIFKEDELAPPGRFTMPQVLPADRVVPDLEMSTERQIIQWMGRIVLPKQCIQKHTKLSEDEVRNAQIEKVLSLRRAEIFPNVGTLDNAGTHAVKRRLLAFFAWRVLMVKNKKCPPSDRDNFGLVELKTAGERTAAKITQAARKQVARVRNIRIAQYKGDRVGVPMPTLFSQTSFSRDIESAFATGNFADTRAADSMDGSGVSKPLPRKSDADTLSALRRLRHDVHSANKNTKPRQMNLSTAGFICPLNTTDSETTGIVLNFAMHTTIALGSPRVSILTPLRDAFPALFVTHFTGGAVYDASWKPTSYNERSEDAADAAIADALVRPDARATWIHVNGTPVGISMAPLDALARAARVARRRGIIPRMVDVVESPETQSLYLSDTMGSPRRPVVVTEDWGFKGSWRRIASVLARYGWGPTVTKPRSASIKRPRGTAATEKHGTRGPRRGMPRDIWDALLQTGCIEYISPAEQMVTYIRPNPCRTFAEELGFAGVMHAAEIPRPPPMTHADIHPILSYSETVILIILLETNKSCRGVFSSCMIRSAMKIAGETLSRGTQVALLRGDNPLVDSEGDDILGFGPKSGNARLSHGVNGITAVLPAKSRNQEDSLAMNRAAVELGFGATVTTNTYTATVSTEMFTLAGSTVLGIPPRDASGGRGGAFAAVEDDGDGDDDDVDRKKDKGIAETTGLPAVGDWLEPGDVVIARIGIPRTKEGGVVAAAIREGAIDLCGRERHAADLDPRLLKLLRDESVLVNQTDGLSQVTRVVVRETREPGKRSIVVQTQRVRSVELGRKFSSRQGQKGVVGGIINREDMPFLPDGTIPHFLFNPHGLPSRGTHAFMEECVTGVLAAVLGKAVRATPFHSFHPETIQRVLRRVQHSDSGSGPPLAFDPGAARLMNPDTGELLAPTTVGVIHYLAEPQTASDKRSARTTGPVSGFTRQPLRGRSNQGGQRVGWMGSLSLAASGAGAVLQDRITRSDPVYACVCSKCGLFARNRKTGASLVEAREVDVEPYCIGCKTGDYTGVVRVPYAWVVFSELLRSAGISTRLDVDMNVDGDDMGLPAPGFAAFRGYGQPWQTTLLKSHKTYVEAGSTARADTATATTPNSGQSRHRSGRRRQQRTLPVVRARSSSSSTLTADQGRSQILAAAKRRRGRWDAVASDEAAGLHISKSSATAVFDPTLAAAAAEFSAAPSASASALAAPNVADMYSSHFTDDGFVGDGGTDTMPPASPPFRLDGGTTEPTTYPEPYSPVDAAAIPPSDYGAAGGYTPYSPTSVVPDYSTRIYSPTSPYPATAQDDESRAFSPTEMDE